MLKWTADFPSAHASGKLPVLDICMWTVETDKGTLLEYEFYSKPMANPVTIPTNSAISQGMKLATYRQEVLRVLSNTSYSLPWSRKAELLSNMSTKMQQAGYDIGFRVTAINGGIRAHLKCLSNQQLKGVPLHRPKDWEGRSRRKRKEDWFQPKGQSKKFSSIVFVPATPGSGLVRVLQQQEEQNTQGRTNRVKFIEKTGVSVRNMLAKNYPWSVEKCGHEECFQCNTCGDPKFSCRKPGIGYEITCLLCSSNGISAVYQGESSKNAFARGKKHLQELRSACKTNCMVIHNTIHHDSPTQQNFQMRVLRTFRSPMERQIEESIRIKDSTAEVLMNSGSEWRADKIPRAAFQAPGIPKKKA